MTKKMKICDMPELGNDKQDYIDDFNSIENDCDTGIEAIDCEIIEHYTDRMGNELVDVEFTVIDNSLRR